MVVLVLGDVIWRWVVVSSDFWEEILCACEMNDKMFLRDDDVMLIT